MDNLLHGDNYKIFTRWRHHSQCLYLIFYQSLTTLYSFFTKLNEFLNIHHHFKMPSMTHFYFSLKVSLWNCWSIFSSSKDFGLEELTWENFWIHGTVLQIYIITAKTWGPQQTFHKFVVVTMMVLRHASVESCLLVNGCFNQIKLLV